MSRIFISHSSRDNPAAVAIAEWLKEEGWDDAFLDLDPVQGIHPGERWERALYDHAADCEAVLFLVSKSWLESEWCKREFDLARKLNKRCFVILIEQISIDELPLSLKETHQTVSLATGEDHKVFRPKLPITHQEGYVTFSSEGLRRLKIGLENAGLDPRFFLWPPASDARRSPYRGLEALDSIDAGVFFGRDGPIIQALDQLRGLSEAAPPRIFVILGASGAGKSSFLRAGLLPRLARDNRAFIVLPVIRPEGAAISGPVGLIESIAEAFVQRGLNTTRAEIRQAITNGAGSLHRILKAFFGVSGNEKRSTIILTIDQAEELFRAEAADESNALLGLVKEIATTDDPAVIVIFVIRSDSYDVLQRAKPLEGLKQETFALLPMPHGAYQTVIEGPLKRLRASGRKFEIDPGLTEALLEDIEQGGGSDALPLLAFTLQLLYRDHEAAKHISLDDYRDFGGLKGAINAALKRAFAAADADPRVPRDYEARLALLRRGFIPWLAGVDPETRTLRRRVARAAQIPEEARPLLNLLVEERLLTRDVDKQTGEATVEPAHEALLRQWGGLKGWLEEDFGRLAALEGVKRATTDWDANARNKAWLAHGGGRLAEANQLDLRPDLAELLNGTDRAYLAACRSKEQETLAGGEERLRAEANLEREKHQRIQQHARFMHQVAVISGMAAIGLLALSVWVIRERNTAIAQIDAATKTANYLVKDLVSNIKNISGVPVATVLTILKTAHQLQEDLTESGFKNTELAQSHALSRERMVLICIEFGDLKCALESADEAVELRRSLLEADPESDEKQMDLARAENRVGDAMRESGDLDEALHVYNKALGTQVRLIPTKDFNAVWLSDLASSREGIELTPIFGDGLKDQAAAVWA
jgi:tetratricopeptide (TPR) repeat protein